MVMIFVNSVQGAKQYMKMIQQDSANLTLPQFFIPTVFYSPCLFYGLAETHSPLISHLLQAPVFTFILFLPTYRIIEL